jgi:hypothetical protein
MGVTQPLIGPWFGISYGEVTTLATKAPCKPGEWAGPLGFEPILLALTHH